MSESRHAISNLESMRRVNCGADFFDNTRVVTAYCSALGCNEVDVFPVRWVQCNGHDFNKYAVRG